MEHSPIQSSTIESAAYDAQTKEMHVKFKSGSTYAYQNVPYDIHAKLLMAKSAGKFLHANVKPNYAARQV